jgi:hypothetical protein
MDQRFAGRANAAQQAARRRFRDVIGHVAGRAPGRLTAQAKELAGATCLLVGFARFEERANVLAVNEKRTLIVRRSESSRDPSTNRVLVRAQESGRFGYRVVAMDFDAAATVPPRHALGRLFDEVSDVLDLPRGSARAELHRLRKAPRLDALPPGRPSHRDRPARRQDRAKAKKSSTWKIHLRLFVRCFRSTNSFHMNLSVRGTAVGEDSI